MNPNIVWGALFLIGLAYELYGVFNHSPGDTLSERTRAWFHTHGRRGRGLFLLSWLLFTAWFVPHIVNGGLIPF